MAVDDERATRPRLYARGPLLRALVPRLVGLALDRRELVPQEHRDDLPVTLLTGRHGLGKTAVLDALEAGYRGRVPLGRVDAARVEQVRRPGPAVSNTSAAVEILEQLVCELSPPVPRNGMLRFPRLLPGLFSVSSWHRGHEPEQRLAGGRISRLLDSCGLGGGGEQWAYDVGDRLVDPDQDDLASITTAVVGQYFSRYAPGRRGRSVLRWYRERSEGAEVTEDGEAALLRLSLRFHQGDDFRRSAERTLFAAFLADLADSYGWWKRADRTPRPLVLLDNAHTATGQWFLDLLLEHRAGPAPGARDPLVVVATHAGSTARYPHATVRGISQLGTASGWARAVPGSPSAGLLSVPLDPLSRDDLLLMLDRARSPLHRHLPSALYDLTLGHPQASRLLCTAVVKASGEHPVEPQELLDLPGQDGRPVGKLLLELLVPEPRLRENLPLLALTRDREAGRVVVAPPVLAEAERYLAEEHWADSTGDSAGSGIDTAPEVPGTVSDPLLRALLVHEARRVCAAEPGQRWTDLHDRLREHHTELGAGHERDSLRHTLALGSAQPVVDELMRLFRQWEADRWYDMLRYTATAPHPPATGWTDHRAAIAGGRYDGRYAEPEDVRRSVNRLLHAHWYVYETLTEPRSDLYDDIAAELEFLSMKHPSGSAALRDAAQSWRDTARRSPSYPR